MRKIPILLAVLGSMAASAKDARACECKDTTPSIVLPRDGATDVPTNARVLVSAALVGQGRWAAADASAQLPALAIRRSDKGKLGTAVGAAVSSMMSEAWGTVYVVTPKKPLAANTSYSLTRPGDDQKPAVVATFTTGAKPDASAPVFAGLDTFTSLIVPQRRVSKCDGEPPSEQLTWTYGEAADDRAAAGDLLRILYVQRKGESRTIKLIEPAGAATAVTSASDGACEPFKPIMAVGDELCATLEVVDLAGNAAGAAVERCYVTKKLK